LIGQSLDGPVAAADIAAAGGSYSGLLETLPPFRTFVRAGASPSRSIAVSSETGDIDRLLCIYESGADYQAQADWNEW